MRPKAINSLLSIITNKIIHRKSNAEFARAKRVIPGGVNSPVRSFKSINSAPIFIRNARGSKLYDIDNNEYIDYCLSWGVHILGHGYHNIINSVKVALSEGTSYGMPTQGETILAEAIVKSVPSIEMVRLVSSGTEAVMSAVRLARAYSGKKKIIKFDGCYHGHADHLLISAGSGLATLGYSASAGVPEEFIQHTISLPFNNEAMVIEAFTKYRNDIAAIIVEPVPANMGVVLPNQGFLKFLRDITIEYQSLLIFDEVITGFRAGIAGAQGYFGVTPDITTLGKIIGGGFPIGAYGGQRKIMAMVAPEGEMYQAGTLSGNPIAVAGGIAVLKNLHKPDFYQTINHKSEEFINCLKKVTERKGAIINSFNSMFTIFFIDHELVNYEDVKKSDLKRFEKFYKKSLEQGIFFAPSQFETNFISTAHLPEDLNKTLEIVTDIFKMF